MTDSRLVWCDFIHGEARAYAYNDGAYIDYPCEVCNSLTHAVIEDVRSNLLCGE